MKYIAILGFGTVGQGVASLILENQEELKRRLNEEVEIKWILDIRNFPGHHLEDKITHDFGNILSDKQISYVIETMGGVDPAYEFTKALLTSGKSVCTSNKELVEKYGAELMAIAKRKQVNYLFEASVGGGIPVLRTLYSSFGGERIEKIFGIFNGTTNYILTKMREENLDFEVALRQAQELGYAELNSEADIKGLDTARKLAILMSSVLKKKVHLDEMDILGIEDITKQDIDYAKALGGRIKLVAEGSFIPFENAVVEPRIVFENNLLFGVEGVLNSVAIKGNMVDEINLVGKGAGSLPTASAVVSDLIWLIEFSNQDIMNEWSGEIYHLTLNHQMQSFLCRFELEKVSEAERFGLAKGGDWIYLEDAPNEGAVIIKSSSRENLMNHFSHHGLLGIIRLEGRQV